MKFHFRVLSAFLKLWLASQQQSRTTMDSSTDAQAPPSSDHRKRSRPGRATRRRNRKVRAIAEACEAALFRTPTNASAIEHADETHGKESEIMPSDRHRSLPGVMRRRLDRLIIENQDTQCKVMLEEDDLHVSLDQICPGDEARLMAQLGYIPGNAVCVAARVRDCPQLKLLSRIGRDGSSNSSGIEEDDEGGLAPTVLRLYPLAIRDGCKKGKYKSRQRGKIPAKLQCAEQGGKKKDLKQSQQTKPSRDWSIDQGDGIIEPFPTMYWLTDPRLRMLISKLEISSDQNVKAMEAKLKSSPDDLEQMVKAHNQYGHERWDLLTSEDRNAVMERKWDGALGPARGVAGIRDVGGGGIKCLHAHAAAYLAGMEDNVVGRWTIEEVGRMLEDRLGGGVEEEANKEESLKK